MDYEQAQWDCCWQAHSILRTYWSQAHGESINLIGGFEAIDFTISMDRFIQEPFSSTEGVTAFSQQGGNTQIECRQAFLAASFMRQSPPLFSRSRDWAVSD